MGIALCQLEVTAGDHSVKSRLCPGAAQLYVCLPPPCGGVTRLPACQMLSTTPQVPTHDSGPVLMKHLNPPPPRVQRAILS